jgi:hypothetical protein
MADPNPMAGFATTQTTGGTDPTPQVNPTAPVGGVSTNISGIDTAGNIWLRAGPPHNKSSWTFVATVVFPTGP